MGSTGAATGPHLHYEFLMNGVHRNPRTIHKKLPKAKSLPESEMARFRQAINEASTQLAACALTTIWRCATPPVRPTRPINLSTSDALYVGLMSGTSVDAIDAALVRCSDNGVELLHTHQHAIPPQTRQQISAISHSGDDEIERLGVLDRELGLLFGPQPGSYLASAQQEPER